MLMRSAWSAYKDLWIPTRQSNVYYFDNAKGFGLTNDILIIVGMKL